MTMAKPDSERDNNGDILTMTVHPLPKATPARKAWQLSARTKLVLLGLACVAPVVASYLTYYVIRPEGRRNSGELIQPQRPLPAINATTESGQTVSLQSLKHQWLLISVGGGACDTLCQSNLYFARQLRESLGKDSDRLEWVWLVSDAAPINPSLKPAVNKATVLRVSETELATWLQPSVSETLPAHLYLVDPLGNWMMRFGPRMDLQSAGKAKRDLERLLKASSFWDKPGRP